MIRYYQVNGEWITRVDGNPSSPLDVQRAEVADAFGVDVNDVTVVEVGKGDPRTGVLVDMPGVIENPIRPKTIEQRLAEIEGRLTTLEGRV